MVLDWDEPRPGLTPETWDALQDRYGLEPVADPRDLSGSFSLNVLVEAHDGRYVARVHGSQTSPARLSEIQQIRRYLGAHEIPSPRQVQSTDGERFVVVRGRPP